LLHLPKEDAQKAQAAMFSDPNMAMDTMKKNLSMIEPIHVNEYFLIRASVDVRHASKHVCPFGTTIFCRNSKGMKLKIIFPIQEILNLMKYISQFGLGSCVVWCTSEICSWP